MKCNVGVEYGIDLLLYRLSIISVKLFPPYAYVYCVSGMLVEEVNLLLLNQCIL